MKKTHIITICLLFSSFFSFGQKQVSTASLLKEMVDVKQVTQWPDPFYETYQASSYDRHSIAPGQPGWFANADASQFIRTEQFNGRKEYVMMDEDGPGAIVRFWLTTFKRDGTLRVYFDNHPKPELEIQAYDLMKSGLPLGKALLTPHSSYEPKEKGGNNLYLPMPFSKHCKVTWEDAEPEIKQPRYYQINYRKYVKGTPVKTFELAQLRGLKVLLNEVDQKLLHPSNNTKGRLIYIEKYIEAQEDVHVKLPAGRNAITLLKITLSADNAQNYAQALRSTILQITFDNKKTVWCPIGDFSGSGVGGKPLQSWYRTVDDNGQIVSRWVMPYSKDAEITILNTGSNKINIQLSANINTYQWNKNSMYFHADWKAENNVEIKKTEQEKPIEWNLNAITGKGVFMGESLAVFNHMHSWYGEGDQKLWIDNGKFPAEYGTGTEDYYNTSWAPVVLYQTPFANAPRADNADSYGYNTFTRTRILDAVPFIKNFCFDLEMLGWQNGKADMAATTYWYGFENASGNKPGPAQAAVKLP